MIALATIIQWLAVPAVRYAVAVAGIVAIVVLWLWRHDAKIEARAEAAVIERSVEAGKKANAKADNAHAAAARPGAAERLRRNACRDCAGK
jgi:hypothetical protein